MNTPKIISADDLIKFQWLVSHAFALLVQAKNENDLFLEENRDVFNVDQGKDLSNDYIQLSLKTIGTAVTIAGGSIPDALEHMQSLLSVLKRRIEEGRQLSANFAAAAIINELEEKPMHATGGNIKK